MDSDLSRRLASLPPEQVRELVKKLNRTSGPELMPRNPEGRYPLSSAQERMWFLAQLSPDSTVLNNPGALRARSRVPLDLEVLGRSVAQVALDNEILRSTFHGDGGRPWQVVHKELPPAYSWTDLSDLDPREREVEVDRLALAEGCQDFDLTSGPLFAFKVLRLDELEYVLLITTHHIISDGWTNAMLAPEIATVYGTLLGSGGAGPASPSGRGVQYVDFVHWERRWLQGEQATAQLAYWKGRLVGDAPLDLPTDRRRPARMSHRGSLETLRLDSTLAARLRDFAKDERVSLFHLLNAAFSALLHRYSGAEVVTLGTQTANRNRREFQKVMGLFASTVVLRCDVDPALPFRRHLTQVSEMCKEALRRQELPFERLIEALKPRRTMDRHPLFQVMHVHQNVPSLYQAPDMEIEVLKIDYGTSKFDLNLWTEEIGDELALTLHYDNALFEPQTARRWLRHYQGLLETVLECPETALEDILVAEGDRPSGVEVHAANALAASDGVFHELFEAQAARSPEAPAVEALDGSLSYAELNEGANRLARHLQALGVEPEDPVGVLLDRTTRAMTAILAVMKAGGAYVPLDPGTPGPRMDAKLRACKARILLTESSLAHLTESLEASVETVDLDQIAEVVDRLESGDLSRRGPGPDGLAYIVFTSGTTGDPKGVCVEHRNLVAYVQGVRSRMGLEPGARFATVTSLAADLGHTMLFPPLCDGGCVVLVPEELITDAPGLAEHLATQPVNCLKTVPSHLAAMLASDRAADLLPSDLLVLGGEECTPDLVERVRSLSPGLRVMNHYGPSEGTVGVLTYEVPPREQAGASRVPLGFPFPGCRIELLDGRGRRVVTGMPGEIHVGGATLARGYQAAPEMTSERFIEDPLTPGERLYRTGDRAVRRDDGAMVFLGRRDRQVKIRGFRVELDEVEWTLSEHPGVAEAAVPVPASSAETLTAYVSLEPGASPSAEDIRRYVAARLPGYGVPGRLGIVDEIPLTANGKIDYHALKGVDTSARDVRATLPRDTMELRLAEIWRELLDVESVGIDDDFFELGGHSLLAVRVMAAIHDEFACRLPLAVLFEHGTVRRLTEVISSGGPVRAESPLVLLRPATGAPCVFVHPAGGNVLCYQDLARELGSERPFWALQAGSSHDDGPEHDIDEMAGRYLEAVLTAPHSGLPTFGGWSMGALVALEVARGYAHARGDLPTVVVLDQLAPGRTELLEAQDESDVARLSTFAAKVSELVGENLDLDPQILESASEGERTSLFLEAFKRHQLAPETTREEDFQSFLDLMLSHNRMTMAHTSDPYEGRIVVVRAAGEGKGEADDRAPDLGWQALSLGGLDIVSVPGSHVSMMRPPHVSVVAARLRDWL